MNDRRVRGLSGATILTLVVCVFILLWFTNQFDQKEEEITWKEFEELAVDICMIRAIRSDWKTA